MNRRSLPGKLSACYKEGFAYPSIKDRLPVILTKVVDTLVRDKNNIGNKYDKGCMDELKDVIGQYSKLKNEIQTDKPFLYIQDVFEDQKLWNERLSLQNSEENPIDENKEISSENILSKSSSSLSWFSSSWLLAECYFYRRVWSAVYKSKYLKQLDPFESQKQASLMDSTSALTTLGLLLVSTLDPTPASSHDNNDKESCFKSLLYTSLWGNRCDLCIFGGEVSHLTSNILEQLSTLSPNVLCDDIDKLWQFLSCSGKGEKTDAIINDDGIVCKSFKPSRVDIVLDNSGFEFFTDLCLADFLTSSLGIKEIHFHYKVMPWFVSDVTKKDWDWTMEWLGSSNIPELVKLSRRWKSHLANSRWICKGHLFWTLPDAFHLMKTSAPDLYSELSISDLIIFKGDLNYRKLTGDRMWPISATPFQEALRGFEPAPLCTLRTIKSDTLIGVDEEKVERASKEDENWLITGSYAVVQFLDRS